MDRFNIPGFHYVKPSTTLFLDTNKEPSIEQKEDEQTGEEWIAFNEDSDRMEEHDTANER